MQTRAQAEQLQKRTRGVSSEPIGTVVESCDFFRGIENLNCVAYAEAADADRRPCEAIGVDCRLVKALF